MGQVSSIRKLSFNGNNPLSPRKKFDDGYIVGERIGVGAFAKVFKCSRKSDGRQFAVKIIELKFLKEKELIGLRTEIDILRKLSHKNIIHLIDAFYDKKTVSMVLELCNGQDLFDEIAISKDTKLPESKCAEIIYQLSNAVQYLHENGVIHRDLKPENILCGRDGMIKITDFGLAYNVDSGVAVTGSGYDSFVMKTCCGTPHYVAPEVVSLGEYYNCKCDMWSIGVILYVMLVGFQPFSAKTLNKIYKLIEKGEYSFKAKRWDDISNEAKDLVTHLMEINPEKRYTPQDVKCHPFVRKYIGHMK